MNARIIVAWVLGMGAIACAQTAFAVEGVGEILQSGEYPFCTDSSYLLTDREHAFCDGVGTSSTVCPGLADACKRPAADTELVPRDGRALNDPQDVVPPGDPRRHGRSDRDDGTSNSSKSPNDAKKTEPHPTPDGSSSPPPRPPDPPKEKETPPTSFGGLGSALFIVLAVVFFGVVAWFIWKNVDRRGDVKDANDDESTPNAPSRDAPSAKPDVIETDVAKLLARARARGETDPRRAMEDAYAALLRRLEGDGLIQLHPSRTNGDYLRAVRERAELRAAMAGVVRDLERVQFGTDDATPTRFRSIYERVVPWVGRAAVLTLLVLGAGASLSCHAVSRGRTSGGAPSPWGTRAIAQILAAHDHDVTYQSTDVLTESTPPSVLFLPSANLTPDEAEEIAERVTDAGGTVVFAGGAPRHLGVESTPIPGDTGTLLAGHRETSSGQSATLYAPPTAHFTVYPRGATIVIDRNASLAETRGQRFPYAVRYSHHRGTIIAFADGVLFHNIALVPEPNAAFLETFFLQLPKGDVDLYDAPEVAISSSPVDAVANAHLTPVLLQLLLAAVLLFLYKGVRFGQVRDVAGVSRRAFVEHVRAIGAAFRRVGASRHALGLFGAWAIDRIREQGIRGNLRGTRQLARVIAARTGDPEAVVLATLQEVRAARSGSGELEPPSSRQGPPSASVAPPQSTAPEPPTARDVVLMRRLDGYLHALKSAKPGHSPPSSSEPLVSTTKA